MNPEQHRKFRAGAEFRSPDIQIQTVFAKWTWIAAVFGRKSGHLNAGAAETVRLANSLPCGRRLRFPPSQVRYRSSSIGNSAEEEDLASNDSLNFARLRLDHGRALRLREDGAKQEDEDEDGLDNSHRSISGGRVCHSPSLPTCRYFSSLRRGERLSYPARFEHG